jgi:hypothetical protein
MRRHQEDELLIMATDGLWDVVHNQVRAGAWGGWDAGLGAGLEPLRLAGTRSAAASRARRCSLREHTTLAAAAPPARPRPPPAPDACPPAFGPQDACTVALRALGAAEEKGHDAVGAAKKAAVALTKLALESGTRDNVTVLIIDLRQTSGQQQHRAGKGQA